MYLIYFQTLSPHLSASQQINLILTFQSVVVFHFWGHAMNKKEKRRQRKKEGNCAAENSIGVLNGLFMGHGMRSLARNVISSK